MENERRVTVFLHNSVERGTMRNLLIAVCLCTLLNMSTYARSMMTDTCHCDSTIQYSYLPSAAYFPFVDTLKSLPSYRDASRLSSSFKFEYQNDSTRLRMIFTEFLKSAKWTYLSNWCYERRMNWDCVADSATTDYTNAQISAMSRTKYLHVVAGDVLGFYRSFNWLDKNTGKGNPQKFISADNLSYSVELVDSATNGRIALLDSFFISSTRTDLKPHYYAMFPVASRIRWIAPTSFTSITAFIRVNIFSAGTDNIRWFRSDTYGGAVSEKLLNDVVYKVYCANVEAANTWGTSGTPVCGFTCSTSGTTFTIAQPASTSGVTSVRVVDVMGTIHGTYPVSSTSWPVVVTLPNGLYVIVGVASNGQTLCTTKISN